MKITLASILTAFASALSLNNRFSDIEEHLNDKVLYRDNPTGEPNQMENDLDMNSNKILNLPSPINDNEPARWGDVKDGVAGITVPVPGAVGNEKKFLSSNGVDLAYKDILKDEPLYLNSGAGAVARIMQGIFEETVSVFDYGAKGNFVPATQAGDNDLAAFQLALDYCRDTGKSLVIPAGFNYKIEGVHGLGAGASLNDTDASSFALLLDNADGVNIFAYGARIYHSLASNVNTGLFQTKVCKNGGWFGGELIGEIRRDGTAVGDTADENISAIAPSHLTDNFTIADTKIRNFMGDCITVYGVHPGASVVGSPSSNIKIYNNVLKEFFGNGKRSSDSSGGYTGTMSRNTIAVIDAIGVSVHDNNIYGRMDIEPNSNGQNISNIKVCNNTFLEGGVTAQATTTAPWDDEPVDTGSSDKFTNSVIVTGVASIVNDENILIGYNIFDRMLIDISSTSSNEYRATVQGNKAKQGVITIGSASNPFVTGGVEVLQNNMQSPMDGFSEAFIYINGDSSNNIIDGNISRNVRWCIKDVTPANNGAGNVFTNNTNVDADEIMLLNGLFSQQIINGNNPRYPKTNVIPVTLDQGTTNVINFNAEKLNTDINLDSQRFIVEVTVNGTGTATLTGLSNFPEDSVVTLVVFCDNFSDLLVVHDNVNFKLNTLANFSMTRDSGANGSSGLTMYTGNSSSNMVELSRTLT